MNSSSNCARIAASGVSNSFSPIVLLSDESTNDEDDDAGDTGIADGAGGEYECCGIGACDPTESRGNTGLGVLRFAKHCPTWTRIMWMQPLMT
jgi:hypothetical protein